MTGDEFLYGKRHAPPVLKKLDDIANEVNTKLRMRGIARRLDKQKFGFQEGGKELCMMKEKERS